jgi:branched-chain amino acid transport system ATP-binding protein
MRRVTDREFSFPQPVHHSRAREEQNCAARQGPLLDEPTEGVWIGVIEEIIERLIVLAREIAVVIVEQHLDLAMRVASRAYVLDRGRVALSGPSREVGNDPRLLRYLAP